MPPRVFAHEIASAPATIRLPDEEARHVARVLRASVGDELRVFDGRGREWLGRIESIGRSGVIVRTLAETTPSPELATRIVVAQSVLKADGMDEVVRDAVMLGAAAIQPVTSVRTEVPAATLSRGRRVERWQRVALASAKQCGRAVVPRIEAVLPFERFVAEATSETRLMFIEPSMVDGSSMPVADWERLPKPSGAVVAIGPEGGWSGDEVDRARARGFILCSLGGLTLRAERAALVALSILRFVWKD